MKIKLLLISIFVVCVISIHAQENYSKVRIYADMNETVSLMNAGIDMENIGGKPGIFIDIELNSKELSEVEKLNLKYEVLIENVAKFYKQRYEESVLKFGMSKKGKDYTTPVNFNFGSMGGFLTLDEIYAELDEMTSLYPNLISAKYTVGNSQTIESRDVYAIRISDNPNVNESEPEVLYTALTHAREPAAMQALIWYMWYLLENYGTDDEITYLVDNLEMYFVPAVNPDGYEYNYQTDPNGGGMWRKNKRDNNGGGFSEYYDGVDLNRNYGYQWGYDNSGSSPDPGDATYRGTAAFSEPETQIIRDFTNEHEFLLAHNHHTYSNLIIIPWGYDEIHSPDDEFLRTSANFMASENGYTVGQGWEILYVVNGDANDWMYGEQSSKPKIFSYTQETGSSSDGFWPSQSRIIPLCEESFLSNLYLARFATPYVELTDISPQYITHSGELEFNVKRMGLSGNGNYTVSITPDPSVFESLSEPMTVQLDEPLESTAESISYTLSSDIEYGDEFTYTMNVIQENYSHTIEITKSYYEIEVILEDPGDDINNWTTDSWSVTEEDAHSPSSSITDSEGGNYGDDQTNTITLLNEIDLTNIENPSLNFWTKWNIEVDWDYAQIFISTDNGSSWTPIETEHTNPGTGSFQPTGEPVYDGSSPWIEENVDLSAYTGQAVKFRFELHSDGYVNEDGFYFDDFSIFSTQCSGIIDQPENIEANIGDNVTFSVNAFGTDLNYQWRKDTENITGANDASYTISNVQTSDEGSYDVVIMNDCGNITSDPATVSIVSSVNSLNEINIDIFPNPSTGSFIIETNNNESTAKIIVSNVTGKIICSETDINRIEINNIQKGVYFVTVQIEDKLITKKVIVQ